jgi:hypothetical protein
LRRAGKGKSKHGGYTCRRQPFRHMSRTFQLSPRSFRVCGFFYSCFARLLPTRALRVCRDFVLYRQLIKQLKIGI